MATQEPQKTEIKEIPVDEIEASSRAEKLHPPENEDDEAWELFKEDVGVSSQHDIHVRKNGDGYEPINGDRRFRAVQENGGEMINAKVF